MASQYDVLNFLWQADDSGERAALIVLTGVEGGAARGIGTLVGVSEAGAWIGSLSGGCVEAALVGEARRVIASGKAETLRLGAGSPLIDIRLPCGSGLDLLIVPQPDFNVLMRAGVMLDARMPVELSIRRDGTIAIDDDPAPSRAQWRGDTFLLPIAPRLRLLVIGQGEEVASLASLARSWGADVLALTPDERTAALAGDETIMLKRQGPDPLLRLDPWAALVMLFHDHDWEVPLLVQALAQESLFVGAMGSTATHARRLALLAEAGVSPDAAARIKGPVGLIPAARDPQTMALSVLAEVVAAYNSTAFASRLL